MVKVRQQQDQCRKIRLFQMNRGCLLPYTVLFAGIIFFAYLPFWESGTSFIRMYHDSFDQHYENRVWLRHAVSSLIHDGSFPFWSWSIGLGADTIGSLGYVIFDPFSYITAAFPEKWFTIGYTAETIIRLYAAGLGFLYFGKVTGMSRRHSIIGAVAYSCSSWALIVAGLQIIFLLPLVLFPFIMAGVEKVLRGKQPFVLIFSVTLSVVSNLYLSYMSALIVFLYLLVYFVKKEQKTFRNTVRFWGSILLYLTAAALLVAAVLFTAVYTLANTNKDTALEYSLFHTFSIYVNGFSFLLSGQELFYHYSAVGVFPLFLILIPVMVRRAVKRMATPAMVVFLLCLIFLAFPFFNSVFNGLSYPVGRWCYAATFFYIWGGIQCMESGLDIRKYRKSIVGMLAVSGFMLVVVSRILLKYSNEISVITGVVNLAFAYVFYKLLTKRWQRRRSASALMLAAAACSVVAVLGVRNIPGVSTYLSAYTKHGDINRKLENATQRAGTEIADHSFYRIDQIDSISAARVSDVRYANASDRLVHIPPNETLVFGTRSIYTYLSSTPGHLFEYYRLLGNNASYFRRVCTFNNDNRTRMDFLTGVKYFLGNNPKNNPPTGANEYASYGFSLAGKSSQGVDILQNKYSIGLGCTFGSYMTQSEWERLDYPDREQALMQCAVLPDGTDTKLRHQDDTDGLSGAERVSFRIKNVDGMSIGGTDEGIEEAGSLATAGTISLSKAWGGFTAELDREYGGCELYLIARNLRRDVDSTNELRFSESSGIGRIERMRAWLNTGKDYDDSGGFTLNAVANGRTKRALNLSGEANGFPNIRDYMINLGEYREGMREITVSLNTVGDYTYDSIEVIAVPLSTYENSAAQCVGNTYQIDRFSDDYVSGTVETGQASSMLYLSIPYHAGWRAYVDGGETPTCRIDVAFTGVPVNGEGRHTVELRYRPVGYRAGIVCFLAGIVMCAGIGFGMRISRQHRRNRSEEDRQDDQF